MREDLCAEAIRLARLLVELMPDEPEVVGLLALLLLTESRRPARLAADGSIVLLPDQDRDRWDRALIEEGQALVRACLRRSQPGPFQIQAAIDAVHADARDRGRHRLAPDRPALRPAAGGRPDPGGRPQPSRRRGRARRPRRRRLRPSTGCDLDAYPPFHISRAELLVRAGRPDEAVVAYDRALDLVTNAAERRFLLDRRDLATAG